MKRTNHTITIDDHAMWGEKKKRKKKAIQVMPGMRMKTIAESGNMIMNVNCSIGCFASIEYDTSTDAPEIRKSCEFSESGRRRILLE